MSKEVILCPKCNKRSLEVEVRYFKDRFFGYEAIIEYRCSNCGYRNFDIFPLEVKKPKRIKIKIEGKEDLGILIARFRSASLYIPEIGLELIPSIDSRDLITTVEGILIRFLEVIKVLERDKEVNREKLEEVKNKISMALKGELKFTLVIEDPLGISKIESSKVEEEELELEGEKKITNT